MTPNRSTAVRRITWKNYTAFSKTIVKLHSGKIIKSLSCIIKSEFSAICSDQHESILRGTPEAIRTFTWSKVWNEMQQHLPTLVSLLTAIIPGNNQQLVCTIISMLLKKKTSKNGVIAKGYIFIVLRKWSTQAST